jgi:hypothetical protein
MTPRPKAPAERCYVVEVNEVAIFATTIGADWWIQNVLLRPIADRITWLAMTPCGGIAQIPCSDHEEAVFVRSHMIANGIHAKHVTVKRIQGRG